jgi:hypothetical protein
MRVAERAEDTAIRCRRSENAARLRRETVASAVSGILPEINSFCN